VSRGPCRANLCRLRSGRCERGCLVGPSRSTALLLSAATARLLQSAAQRILLLLWSCAGRLLPIIRSRLSPTSNSKPEDQPETNQSAELPPQFRRQLVAYATTEPAGTIIIDTPHTFLYLVLGHGKALRYGIGVGRTGFTWSGTERISRMSKWPDWHPPKEMIERQPYLPRFTAGGEGNPLGARALYLGNTEYRIHGTNQPSTIGHFVSSGCIRLTNEDVEDLYNRVSVGTRVVVLPGSSPVSASAQGRVAR
jgi:lipoprotein-anchoring transpeptidase ErfK/SrfK